MPQAYKGKDRSGPGWFADKGGNLIGDELAHGSDVVRPVVLQLPHAKDDLYAIVLERDGVGAACVVNEPGHDLYHAFAYDERETEDIFNEITDTLQAGVNHDIGFDPALIGNYETVKQSIRMNLCRAEQNTSFLSRTCEEMHRTYGDMAAYYTIDLNDAFHAPGKVIIDDVLAKYEWNVTEEELHDVAVRNMDRIMAPQICSMSEISDEMLGRGHAQWIDLSDPDAAEMLRNKRAMTGEFCWMIQGKGDDAASAFLSEQAAKTIREAFGDDHFVAPYDQNEAWVVDPTMTNISREEFLNVTYWVGKDGLTKDPLSRHSFLLSENENGQIEPALLFDVAIENDKSLDLWRKEQQSQNAYDHKHGSDRDR